MEKKQSKTPVQAVGRFLFVQKIKQTESEFVKVEDDERLTFKVVSIGEEVSNCKVGDEVVLTSGNYEPLPFFVMADTYCASDEDVIGVVNV